MRKIFFPFFFLFSFSLFSQNEIIELGILPSEYGEGMPLQEFKEFERNIIAYLESIERFKIVKRPEDYASIEWGANISSQVDQIKEEGLKSQVPYLFRIIFGDTEWTSTEVRTQSIIDTQNATLWITLNLYNVSTGTLENSVTINAESSEYPGFSRSSPVEKASFKNAVKAGKKSLWKKVKQRIRQLFPLVISIQKIETENKEGAESVLIDIGEFHGFKNGDQLYVYYEKEYIVRGKPTMRHIQVGRIKVNAVNNKSASCIVRKGKDSLLAAFKDGRILKCGIVK